jgi:hypothetical protein
MFVILRHNRYKILLDDHSREMSLVHVARVIDMGNKYKIWGGKLEGEIPLGRRVGRWGNNIKMDAKVTVCEDEGWIVSHTVNWRWVVL